MHHVDKRVQSRLGLHLATWEIDVSQACSHDVRKVLHMMVEQPHRRIREVRILVLNHMRCVPL